MSFPQKPPFFGGIPTSGFFAPLQVSLLPTRAGGSNTPTFTRASAKTQIDFENKYNQALSGEAVFQGARRVRNLVQSNSEDFGVAAWNAGSPSGSASGSVITFTGLGNDFRLQDGGSSGITANHRYVITATIQAGTKAGNIRMGSQSSAQYVTYVPTATPTRISFAYTAFGNNEYFGFVNDGNAGTIIVTRIMVEDITDQANQNPGDYVSVGVLSAPFPQTMQNGEISAPGVDGVGYSRNLNGNTVSSNVMTQAVGPLIVAGASGVNALAPVDAGGPFGYYAEGAATQLIAATADIRDMTTANWTLGATLTRARTQTGADGVANSATLLTGGAVTATNTIAYTLTAAASSRTYSALVKRVTGTGPVQIMQNATLSDISGQLVAGQWVLVHLNANVLNAAFGFRVDTNGDQIAVDMNQFEAGAFATSRMLTGGMTRAADALTYPTASNFSDTAGTMYAEVHYDAWANATGSIVGSATQGMLPLSTNSGVSGFDGTNTVNGTAGTPSGVTKMGVTWTGTTMTVAAGGAAAVVGSYDGTWNLSSVGVGLGSFATVRNVKIWLVPLTSAQLVQQTTP